MCEGYVQRLRWLDDAPSSAVAKIITESTACDHHTHRSTVAQYSSTAVGLQYRSPTSNGLWVNHSLARLKVYSNPSPEPILLRDPRDQLYLSHWLATMQDIIYLDQGLSIQIQSIHLYSLTKSPSIMLPLITAVSAAHMFAQGITTATDVLSAKSRAFRAVRKAMQPCTDHKHNILSPISAMTPSCDIAACFRSTSALEDLTISASIMLGGIEVMQGAEFSQFDPILQGTTSLIKARHHCLSCVCRLCSERRFEATLGVGSLLFINTSIMVAYFDIMCCVPCARSPLLDVKYWPKDVDDVRTLQSANTAFDISLDPVMGYCRSIFAILGESSTLIDIWYTGGITLCRYREAKDSLMVRLRQATQRLPQSRPQSMPARATDDDSNHNACVSAAHAHSLATQIFLLRSTDYSRLSTLVSTLIPQLWSAVLGVPFDSYATTMMLWPLWVLGCECFAGESRQRAELVTLFDRMFDRQSILNIRVCLETLRSRIWGLGTDFEDPSSAPTYHLSTSPLGITSPPSSKGVLEGPSSRGDNRQLHINQASWVWYCWDQKIQLVLA